MEESKLTVIGGYRPQVSPETWQKQWGVTADDEATKEHFDHLVLIEATVSGLSERFEMIEFGQPDVNHPEHGMQVGYDEGLLNADGTVLIIS